MPHINLLPWREELRKRHRKEFAGISLAAVVIMFGIIILVHFHFKTLISYQQNRNHFLEIQIARLDEKIKEIKTLDEEKKRLLVRMEIIQQLQAGRPEIVHLFDELVLAIPDGVYFEKLVQHNQQIRLSGYAQSNARVSSLMRRLVDSPWLENANLLEIKAQTKSDSKGLRFNQFSLQLMQRDKKQANSQEMPHES